MQSIDKFEDYCTLYFFYLKTCPFSIEIAQKINALPMIFPQIIILAIDVNDYWNLSLKYGLLYVPNLILLKGSTIIGRLKEPINLDNIISFIVNNTDLEPKYVNLNFISDDFSGPIPTKLTPESPLFFYLSMAFLSFLGFNYVFKHDRHLKRLFHKTIDTLAPSMIRIISFIKKLTRWPHAINQNRHPHSE
ncbi:unnamed protein product [Gordionus sp. m RMFG-2023]